MFVQTPWIARTSQGGPPGPPHGGLQVDHAQLPTSVLLAGHGGEPLFSLWVPSLLALGALLAVAAWGMRIRRGRRDRAAGNTGVLHRLGSVLGFAGCLLLVALTVASAVNVYAGYLPTPASVEALATGRPATGLPSPPGPAARPQRLEPASFARRLAPTADHAWHVATLTLPDRGLDIGARTVLVATPPGYATGTAHYPVYYLLSGYPGRASDWFVSGRITQVMSALVAAGRARYAILVAPDVNGSLLTDSETLNAFRGPQVQTWLSRDVTGYVDRHYRTIRQRSDRVLLGMSSGGFAALNTGLRAPGVFGIVLALEPYGDPGRVTDRLLGGSVTALHANSPSWYAPTMVMTRSTPAFLDVGSQAGADVGRVRALAVVLAARHQPVDFRIEPREDHTWREAVAGLPHALAFAQRWLGQPQLDSAYPASLFPA